jgi:DNA-binding response OmpR family regulator
MHILVVDDDVELVGLLSQSLRHEGHRVDEALDLATARAALTEPIDVVVLDVTLPDGSGLTLCQWLRERGNEVPVLLLTAQAAVADRVAGLDAGADDYLAKPFALAELRARVRALGRRRVVTAEAVRSIADVELDFARRKATRRGIAVDLTPREWTILDRLAARDGRVVPRLRVLQEAWGDDDEAAMASLEVLVGRIRRKLGKTVIRTVRGEGYALG